MNGRKIKVSVQGKESPDWLPHGWRMEEKLRKNGSRGDKIYIDLSTGNKFYSKLAVARYLNKADHSSMTEKPKPETRDESFSIPETSLQRKSFIEAADTLGNIIKGEKSLTTTSTLSTSKEGQYLSQADCRSIEKSKGKVSFNPIAIERTTADGLPHGWVKEIKISQSGNKTRKDPYYIDPVSGYMFLSKKDALRYIETNDIGSCAITPKKKDIDRFKFNVDNKTLDNVGPTSENMDVSIEGKPVIVDEGVIPASRKRKRSFTTVSTEITSADGLPPGWIKEITSRKSGNKTRKDPFYIDPINSYVFYSKKDAMRYLETNDIGKCAIIPKRRNLDDRESIESKNLDMTPSKQKSLTDGDLVSETEKGNRQSLKMHDSEAVAFLNPNTSLQLKSITDEFVIPESKKSRKKSLTMVTTETSSVEGLPPGWSREIQTSKSGDKIRKDSYYIDPVDGYVFRSKMDVMRYLETNDISTCAIAPKKRDLPCTTQLTGNKIQVDRVKEPISKPIPLQSDAMINSACITETQKKSQNSSTLVATEISANGLPPGWITEIKTRKNGNNKDPFYTDPVSGYVFRSKKDVLRYLEGNDISCCAVKPKKREATDLNLMKNENPKLSEHYEAKCRPFSGGESKSSSGHSSQVKCPAASEIEISKVSFSPTDSLRGKQHSENSNIDILSEPVPPSQQVVAVKTMIKPSNNSSELGAKAMADVLAICSIINDSFMEEKLPENCSSKQTDGSQLRLRKSKQRRDLNMPFRTSKRLSRSEPELDLNERAISSSGIRSFSPQAPQSFDLDQEKSVVKHAPTGEESLVEVSSNKNEELHPKEKSILERAVALHEIEKLFSEDECIFEKEPLTEVEKTLRMDNSVLIEEDEEKLRDGTISQKPRSCYSSFDDPCLEFAYKTLTGEIPIEDGVSFPSNTGTKESEQPTTIESDIPPGFESMKEDSSSLTASTTFQIDEIPPGFESVAQNMTVEKLP